MRPLIIASSFLLNVSSSIWSGIGFNDTNVRSALDAFEPFSRALESGSSAATSASSVSSASRYATSSSSLRDAKRVSSLLSDGTLTASGYNASMAALSPLFKFTVHVLLQCRAFGTAMEPKLVQAIDSYSRGVDKFGALGYVALLKTMLLWHAAFYRISREAEELYPAAVGFGLYFGLCLILNRAVGYINTGERVWISRRLSFSGDQREFKSGRLSCVQCIPGGLNESSSAEKTAMPSDSSHSTISLRSPVDEPTVEGPLVVTLDPSPLDLPELTNGFDESRNSWSSMVSLEVCQSIGPEFAPDATKVPGFDDDDDDTGEWETIFDDSMIMASESDASMTVPAPEELQSTDTASSLSPQTSYHPVAEIPSQSPDAELPVNALPEGTQVHPPMSNPEESVATITKGDLDVEPSAPVPEEASSSAAVSSHLLDEICSPITDLDGQSPDLEVFFDAPSEEVGPNEQVAAIDGPVIMTPDIEAVITGLPQQPIPDVSSVSTLFPFCTASQGASVQPPEVQSPVGAIPENAMPTIDVESEAETDSTIDYTSVLPGDVRYKESPIIGHGTEADVTIDYPGEPDLADDEAETDVGYISEDFIYPGATGNEPVDLPVHRNEQISEPVGGSKDEASSPKRGVISDLELSQLPGDMSNITSMSAQSGDPGSPDSQDTILFPELPSGIISEASDNNSSPNEERREPLIVTKLKGKIGHGRKLSLDKQASRRLIYDGLGVSRAQTQVAAPSTAATDVSPVDTPLAVRANFAMRHLEVLRRLRESRERYENRTFESGRLHPSESASSWRRGVADSLKEDVAGDPTASLSTFVPVSTRAGSSSSPEAATSTSANASMSAFPSITSAAGVDSAAVFPANPMWKDNPIFARALDSPPSTAPSSYPSSASSSAFVFPLPARKERRDVAVSTSDFDAFLSTAAAPYTHYSFPSGPILPERIRRQPVQDPIRKQQQPAWSWRAPASTDAPALKEREHIRRGGRRPKRSLDAEAAEFYRDGGDEKGEKDKGGNKRQRVIMYL